MVEKKREFERKRIVISDRKPGLPYSKGLMASSIMATGLPPSQAYDVAEKVEKDLRRNKIFSVSASELKKIAVERLRNEVGEEYAKNYIR